MFSSLAKSLFGEPGSKDVKRLQAKVDAINAAEPTYKAMSDDDLKQMTATLKGRHKAGESLDDLLVDAFAVVREAVRISGHFRSIFRQNLEVGNLSTEQLPGS